MDYVLHQSPATWDALQMWKGPEQSMEVQICYLFGYCQYWPYIKLVCDAEIRRRPIQIVDHRYQEVRRQSQSLIFSYYQG